jgi:hypothetical protein
VPDPDINTLFHQLNNQLGVILANAELLEHRLADPAHKSRAGQVVSGALEAISTAKQIKQMTLEASRANASER